MGLEGSFHGQVGANPAKGFLKAQLLPALETVASPKRQWFSIQMWREIGTGYGNTAVSQSFKHEARQRDFQAGGIFWIPDQTIRQSQGEGIHSATRRDSQMLIPDPAVVLKRC
jgi:hypothetical protein